MSVEITECIPCTNEHVVCPIKLLIEKSAGLNAMTASVQNYDDIENQAEKILERHQLIRLAAKIIGCPEEITL